MKNLLILIIYILYISVFTVGCNLEEKKKNTEAGNSEISNETGTSIPQNEPQSMTFKMKLWQKGIDFYARGFELRWIDDGNNNIRDS